MTQEEFDKRMKEIKNQEKKFGVEIEITQLIDKDHLDCVWYGGEVGRIKYKGYSIVISAYGDIRIYGKIKGQYVAVKDKGNNGSAYDVLARDYHLDDDAFYALAREYPDSFKGDKNNLLEFENNNWFEVDLISPSGEWIDLCFADNVLSNNLLDCFTNVEDYFEYVDEEIKRKA